jgi:hypothetical protein
MPVEAALGAAPTLVTASATNESEPPTMAQELQRLERQSAGSRLTEDNLKLLAGTNNAINRKRFLWPYHYEDGVSSDEKEVIGGLWEIISRPGVTAHGKLPLCASSMEHGSAASTGPTASPQSSTEEGTRTLWKDPDQLFFVCNAVNPPESPSTAPKRTFHSRLSRKSTHGSFYSH